MQPLLLARGVYYTLIGVLLVLLISSFPHRVAHFDDAWGAELSYWLVKSGRVRSELFAGLGDGVEQQSYVYHKAFIYFQAALMRLFGFNLYVVKSTGLIFSIVGLGLLLRYFREQAEAQWLAALLYLGCGALVSAAFVGRPEPMVMSAGLASFLLLRKARGRIGYLALAGGLGALASLAHLHGLIFLMAGGLWLLWQRTKWLGVLAFTVAGTIGTSIYLLDAVLNRQLAVLLAQFRHAPVTQANQHGWAKLGMLLQYQRVYFHSEGEAMLTTLLLLLLLLTWRRIPRGTSLTESQQYLLLLVLSFWVLCARADGYYFLLPMPFFIIVVIELALGAWPYLLSWRRVVLQLLLVLYPVGAGLRAYHLWREKQQTPWPATENALLARYMPRKGSIAIVPLDFFFNEISHYRLRGLTAYAMRNHTHYQDTLSTQGFFALAAQDSAEYIVTTRRTHVETYYKTNASHHIGSYTRVFETPWHTVYQRSRQ